MFSEEQKKMINLVGGIALFITGGILLMYSLFLLFFQETKKNITSLLPKEGFQILISMGENAAAYASTPIGSFIQNITSTSSLSSGMIVGYKTPTSLLEYIFIFESDKKPASYQHCQLAKGYHWCSQNNVSTVDWFISQMNKKTPSLSSWDYFEKNRFLFDQESDISYIGASSFLLTENSIELLSHNPITQKKTHAILQGMIPVAPLFSGNMMVASNKYSFGLHKKDPIRIYPKSSTQDGFNGGVIPKQSDNMVMIQAPYALWEYADAVADPSDFPVLLQWQQMAKNAMQESFSQKLSWNQDLVPLLKHDMLIFSHNHYTSALFLLPSQALAKAWYERFSTILLEKSAEKIPSKKEHIVADGTTIVEIFPETSSIVPEKKVVANGEGITFSAPLEVEKKIFPATAYLQNKLFISESSENLGLFLEPHDEYSIFPKDTPNIFLAFKWKAADGSFIFPIVEANGVGKEIETALIFEWTMQIAQGAMNKKPIEGILATPFPTLP